MQKNLMVSAVVYGFGSCISSGLISSGQSKTVKLNEVIRQYGSYSCNFAEQSHTPYSVELTDCSEHKGKGTHKREHVST